MCGLVSCGANPGAGGVRWPGGPAHAHVQPAHTLTPHMIYVPKDRDWIGFNKVGILLKKLSILNNAGFSY